MGIAPFHVWVQIECASCATQIVGADASEHIPHETLAYCASALGAARAGRGWLCRSCLKDLAETGRTKRPIVGL